MSADLADAIEEALSDLECVKMRCWCFTRAAMKMPECDCTNCQVWRSLGASLDQWKEREA